MDEMRRIEIIGLNTAILFGGFIDGSFEPRYGFKTGLTKESSRKKPKRSYAGEVSYLGGGMKLQKEVNFNNVLKMETSENDELMVMNKSRFYMCPLCGYSEIQKEASPVTKLQRPHKNHRLFKCTNEELECLRIGHRFRTDVTTIVIPSLSMIGDDASSKALSFLYALIEGVSEGLEIERNDINGLLVPNMEYHSYDILIYDDVPGGAGHVKRLLNKESMIASLKAALAKVSHECCDEDTSCYNCLRNYYNQAYHSMLKRRYAKEIITNLINALGTF